MSSFEEKAERDALTYTEQLLHTLDEFETPRGCVVKNYPASPYNQSWRISVVRVAGRGSAVWLAENEFGYGVGLVPNEAHFGRLAQFPDAGDALEFAQDRVLAEDAAARLASRLG